ncbi:MAG: restriction endonuclease subunit S [Pseudomonadota bacterium]
MISNWTTYKIEDIAEKISIGPFGSRMKSNAYVKNGVPVIRGTNLTGGKRFSGDWVFISEDLAEQLENCCVSKGDLVFPHRGAIGEVGLVDDIFPKYMMSSSLMKLRCNPNLADSEFIYYFFKSNQGKHELLKNASQVGTPGIGQPLSSLKSIEITLPSLSQQKKIAKILSDLDDKIHLNNQVNQTLESISQAVFKSWFIDVEPVKAKIQAKEAHKDPELAAMCAITGKSESEIQQMEKTDFVELQAMAALFPDELVNSELGKIPKGWELCSFDHIVKAKKGKNITKKIALGGEIPVVAGGLEPAYFHNIHNVEGPTVTISASGANAGYVNIYHENIWASDCSFISKQETPYLYSVYTFLKIKQQEITNMQQGAAQPHVYPKDLSRLKFLDIPEDLWFKTEKILEKLFLKIALNSKEANVLRAIRDNLLPKLLLGEIDVSGLQGAIDD